MKTRLTSLAFFVLSISGILAADAPVAASLPAYTIPNSEVRVLPRNAEGRQYQLQIGLPSSYRKSSTTRYPVVYVTDGYWDFTKITNAEGSLSFDKVVPEYISVGIGYAGGDADYDKLRIWELSPVPMPRDPSASGHAAEFLETIEKEVIPLIDREYRTDPSHRVLGGASLGGVFTLYTMYTKPELFSGYIALTPSVHVGNDWLFGYEEKFAANHRPIKARLFMAGGGNEAPDPLSGILRFNQRIASRKYEGLTYEFRIIDGERHAGMQLEAYVRALRFVFAPLAPESGPASD